MSAATAAPPGRGVGEVLEEEVRRRALALVNQLQVALRTATTHEPSNQVFIGAVDELERAVDATLAGREETSFAIALDEVYVDQGKLRMDVATFHGFRYLREHFAEIGVGGFALRAPIRRQDIAAMAHLLGRAKPVETGTDGAGHLNQQAAARGICGVRFDPPQDLIAVDPAAAQDRKKKALRTYQEALSFLKNEMSSFPSTGLLNIRRGKRLVQALVDTSYDKPGEFAFAGLAAIRSYHPYTFNHIVNVCLLSIAFGQRLGLSRTQLCEVGLGALFHDIGKLCIPLSVLNKDVPLTDDEWRLIQQHPLFATRKLLSIDNMTEAGISRLLVAVEHHMGYDLSGYPTFRKSKRPHIYSRIVAIVDAYDAMISQRSYNRAMLPTEALQNLVKKAGTRFDPLLVKAFIDTIGAYPVGTLVELATGELAVVASVAGHQEMPDVRLVRDADGSDLGGASVSLSDPAQSGRKIVRCLQPKAENVNVARYALL